MSIHRFLDEVRAQTLSSADAADLRRKLRELPTRYRESSSATETVAGYSVGEQRLITLRNEAALATIQKKAEYREKILDMIAHFIVEATAVLRPSNQVRTSDIDARDRARTRPVLMENVGARIPAGRWADTAQPMR